MKLPRKSTPRFFLGIGLLILGQSGSAQTKPNVTADSDKPPVLSRDFHVVAQLALEAIQRVDEAREEPSVSYEPRRLDAEKAMAEARRKTKTAEDKHVADILGNYFEGLRHERSPSFSRRATKEGEEYWEHHILPCSIEAQWYFGAQLSKAGIDMAKTGTCASDSKPKGN